MANFNKLILAGNLTRDPQLSHLPSNTPVVEFGMAINRNWRDKQTGENREETCFVDCRAYGRQAETFNQYMSKGRPVLIEGRLQYQSWTANDGSKRSRHMVIVESFQFLGGRDGGGGGSGAGRGAPAAAGTAPTGAAPTGAAQTGAAQTGTAQTGTVQTGGTEFAPQDDPPPPSDSDIPF